MISIDDCRITRTKGRIRRLGNQSIEQAREGVLLGFNNMATISICHSLERFGLEWFFVCTLHLGNKKLVHKDEYDFNMLYGQVIQRKNSLALFVANGNTEQQ